MQVDTIPFDAVRYLDTDQAVDAYLAEASESGNLTEIAHALGVVSEAKAIADLARKTGMTRKALYELLNGEGDLETAAVLKVADALGYKLALIAKKR